MRVKRCQPGRPPDPAAGEHPARHHKAPRAWPGATAPIGAASTTSASPDDAPGNSVAATGKLRRAQLGCDRDAGRHWRTKPVEPHPEKAGSRRAPSADRLPRAAPRSRTQHVQGFFGGDPQAPSSDRP